MFQNIHFVIVKPLGHRRLNKYFSRPLVLEYLLIASESEKNNRESRLDEKDEREGK